MCCLQAAKKDARRFTQMYFKSAAKIVALASRVQGPVAPSNDERREGDQESISTTLSKDQQSNFEKSFTTDSESGITISSENTLTEQRVNEGKQA